ncbi:DUF6169 family protein [Spirosoma lituiforme]
MTPKKSKASNLPHLSPYPLVLRETSKGIVYSFTTEGGVSYQLIFMSDADYLADYPFAESVFSFAIESKNGRVGERDNRIRLTIDYALTVAFQENPNLVITYICSAADGQERHRRILFGWWFNMHGPGFARVQHTDNEGIYSAAIYRNDNPYRDLIESSFNGIYFGK